MKKVHLIWKNLKAEVAAALTPAAKRTICQDALSLASDVLNGVWLELATLLINDVEATIPAA